MLCISIRAARVNSGYSVDDVSKRLNISKTILRRFEKNSGDMPITLAVYLHVLYKIPLDSIYFGKESDLFESALI